jgi:hypothetical protein
VWHLLFIFLSNKPCRNINTRDFFSFLILYDIHELSRFLCNCCK